MHIFFRFIEFVRSLAYAEICSCSYSEKHAESRRKRYSRKDNIGCGISEHANHVTNEYLVCNIIGSSDQHAYDSRDRKSGYQRCERSIAQRIVCSMCVIALHHSLIIPQTEKTKKGAYASAYAPGVFLFCIYSSPFISLILARIIFSLYRKKRHAPVTQVTNATAAVAL